MTLRHFIYAIFSVAVLLSAPCRAGQLPIDPKLVMALQQAVKETSSFSNRLDALTWLGDMSERLKRRIPDPFYRVKLLKTVHSEATRADLEPELVLALIEVESGFDRFAVSPSGARGLTQVMPFWKKEIGHPGDNLFQPKTNLRYGCTILKYYLNRAGGNVENALARYNGSFGHIEYPTKVMLAFNETWRPAAYNKRFIE